MTSQPPPVPVYALGADPADNSCVCGHGDASAHDIVRVDGALRFDACAKAGCCCTGYNRRVAYAGACESCRAYSDTAQALAAEWYATVRADQPPVSDQIVRALVMYGEHVITHLGSPAG